MHTTIVQRIRSVLVLAAILCGSPAASAQENDITAVEDASDVLGLFTIKTSFAALYANAPVQLYRLDTENLIVTEDGSKADQFAFAVMVGPSISVCCTSKLAIDFFWPTFIQTVDSKIDSAVAPVGVAVGVSWALGSKGTLVGLNFGVFKQDRPVLTAEAEKAKKDDAAFPTGLELTRDVGEPVWFIGVGIMP